MLIWFRNSPTAVAIAPKIILIESIYGAIILANLPIDSTTVLNIFGTLPNMLAVISIIAENTVLTLLKNAGKVDRAAEIPLTKPSIIFLPISIITRDGECIPNKSLTPVIKLNRAGFIIS